MTYYSNMNADLQSLLAFLHLVTASGDMRKSQCCFQAQACTTTELQDRSQQHPWRQAYYVCFFATGMQCKRLPKVLDCLQYNAAPIIRSVGCLHQYNHDEDMLKKLGCVSPPLPRPS